MCTNKRFITNSKGKRLLVKCGHCPSCLQEKANSRANKIINHNAVNDSRTCLFVTLTYRNDSVPFIYKTELDAAQPVSLVVPEHGFKEADKVLEIGVYRGSRLKHSNKKGIRKLEFAPVGEAFKLSSILVNNIYRNDILKPLRNQKDKNKIAICYYKDVQDFIKRFRQIVKRDNYDFQTSFYACSEYGPTTSRCHFHLLMWVPSSLVGYCKTAISKAWPFADYHRTYKNIKVAIMAARYVASYVNSDSSIPLLFRNSNFTRPRCSSSKGFGLGKEYLSLPKILEMYGRRDFRLPMLVPIQGIPTELRILFPKYALYRYFFKFKGYCCLAPDTVWSICERPSSLAQFARRLNYHDKDLHTNIVRLNNLKSAFVRDCPDIYTTKQKELLFSEIYSSIWNIYSSNVMAGFYESIVSPIENFEAYDNIKDLFDSSVSNESLESLLFSVPEGYHFETDPNNFKFNVLKTSVMTDLYNSLSKDKKVRNICYSELYGDV